MLQLGSEEVDEDDGYAGSLTSGDNVTPNRNLYRNFIIFSFLFSVLHATVDAILSYASTELGPKIGSYSSFLLFGTYTISALLLAKPFLKSFKTKCGVLFGLIGLLIYVLSFLIALLIPKFSFLIFSMGAGIGGVAAGVLWTSQGSYYSLNASQYAETVGKDEVSMKNDFSSVFAAFYLSTEAIITFLATVIYLVMKTGSEGDTDSVGGNHDETSSNSNGGHDDWKMIVFTIYTIIAFVSVIGFQLFVLDIDSILTSTLSSSSNIQQQNQDHQSLDTLNPADIDTNHLNLYFSSSTAKISNSSYSSSLCCLRDKDPNTQSESTWQDTLTDISAVANMLLTNTRLQLLIPFQVCSGLSNGFITFYVNREIVSKYVGSGYLGLLVATGIMSGAILTWPFAYISNSYSAGKYSVMIFGGGCYIYIALIVLLLPNEIMGASWIFLGTYYILHGAARSVWESTNKSVIAEYFISDYDREAAFAAVYFTSGLAGALGFLLYQFMNKTTMTSLNVVIAVLATVCYHFSTLIGDSGSSSSNNIKRFSDGNKCKSTSINGTNNSNGWLVVDKNDDSSNGHNNPINR